jgi:SEC-C motif
MSRRRDPAITGVVDLPWRFTDTCPCGSGGQYNQCCLRIDGSPYKKICDYKPAGQPTGYSHPGCYMKWTRNCSPTLSGEHFISETVLSILNPKSLRIAGAAWISEGETRDLPPSALKANVLCQRHNSAWSQLDQMAGKFFRALRAIYDDLERRSLSRTPMWHLFSGEELELWLLKTILGFFYARVGYARCVACGVVAAGIG